MRRAILSVLLVTVVALIGLQAVKAGVRYHPGSAMYLSQLDPLYFTRYALFTTGLNVESSTPYSAGDGAVGQAFLSSSWGTAGLNLGDVNVQIMPSFPHSVSLYHRNATAVAASRLMVSSNGGMLPTGLAASESVDFRIGGAAAAGRLCWFNLTTGSDTSMTFRVRAKNFGSWAANDIVNIGWGKPATSATFEGETNVVGFRLQKGAGTEADIYTVYRQASGAVTSADTTLELVAEGNQGLGFKNFEITVSGYSGAARAVLSVDGAIVLNQSLTTLAAGGYAPQIFYMAGAGAAFDGMVIERIEIGPASIVMQ